MRLNVVKNINEYDLFMEEPIYDKLNAMCDRMRVEIIRMKDTYPIPTEEYGWKNYRYKGDLIRQSHFELYNHKNLAVLHVTIFPDTSVNYPIFGFDVVTNTKNNTVSACFLDLSPVNNDKLRWNKSDLKSNIKLPEWAIVFSDDFIAMRDVKKPEEFFEYAEAVFKEYIQKLKYEPKVIENRTRRHIKGRHSHYCAQQQCNERTFGALKSRLGTERAREFMENVLFPKP